MAQDSLRRRTPALVVALLFFIPCTTAHAAAGDPVFDSCTNAGTAQDPCSAAAGQTAAFPQALSPDGRQLYVATAGGTPPGGGTAEQASLLVFDRDPATGALTRRAGECFSSGGSSGACTTVSQLNDPQDVVVSPDGQSVYVSNAGTVSISEFDRAVDGSLTPKAECQGSSGCTALAGMGTPYGMTFDQTGANLYVRTTLGNGAGTLLVFDRSGDGALTQKAAPDGCLSETGLADCRTVAGISLDASQIAVSPDNKNVYATGHDDSYFYFTGGCGSVCFNSVASSGTIAVFTRASDGALSQSDPMSGGCISNNGQSGGAPFSGPAPVRCADGNDALDQASSVTVSADGATVYVGTLNAVVAYSRNPSTGALTAGSCRRRAGTTYAGCVDAPALLGVHRMTVTDSGKRLVAAVVGSGGAAFFDRSLTDGALTPLPGKPACVTQSGTSGACEQVAALGGAGSVAVADDRDIYLTGSQYGTLAHLYFDSAPVCDDSTVDVVKDQAAQVPLTCRDRDGDALTLAVTQMPFAGTLGAVDQAAGRVFYNPFAGFTGDDAFEFTATGGGATSAPATVSLKVAAPVQLPTDSGGSAPPATNGSAGGSTPGAGVAPQEVPTMSATAPRVAGTTLKLTLTCVGPVACKGGIAAITVQKLRGRKVLALSAAKAKLRRKSVAVGSVRFTIAPGKKRTIVLKLNRVGRQLLTRFHRLPTTVTAWTIDGSGKRKTLVTKKLVVKQPKKKAKRST